MSAKTSFFAELQRRNVYKVGAMYGVTGWLLVQVATQVFPFFDVPNWAVRAVVLAIIAGFPVVLVLSWIYELTPQGIVKTDEVAPDASVTRSTGQKLNRAIIAVLSVAVVVLLAKVFWPHADSAPAEAANDKSIAVLPFENLSDDKANAYFADGIQDEILTRLARIGQLKVISRTSTQQYASKPGNLSDIARQLGVANILEGSVQKAGDAVHINVQLIRAASDEHLWADSYNRKLDDIFGVEGEVAQTIAETLKATLTGAEAAQLNAKPTANPQAYDAYLRALAYANQSGALTPNTFKSIDAYQEAVRLDPDFGEAWARLAGEHAFAYWRADHSAAHRQAAREALDAAKRLAPDNEETIIAEGYYRYWVERDYEGAKPLFQRASQLAPSDFWPIYALAAIDRRQGRWQESLEVFNRAVSLNPLGTVLFNDAATTALSMRDLPAAQRLITLGLNSAPNDTGILGAQVILFQETGDLDQAQKILDRVHIEPGDDILVSEYCANATLLRRYAPAIALLKAQLAQPEALGTNLEVFQIWLGDLQRLSGDAAAARKTYTQARLSLQAALRKEPDSDQLLSALAQAEAGLGNQAAALEQNQHAVDLMPASRDAFIGPVYEEDKARLQARFGDKDAAIAGLQHLLATSYAPPPASPALLRLDPDWDNLHGDPRFEKLAAGAGPSPP